jgi:hypothetical protein
MKMEEIAEDVKGALKSPNGLASTTTFKRFSVAELLNEDSKR